MLGWAVQVPAAAVEQVVAVARSAGASSVHITADTGPYGRRRDAAVERGVELLRRHVVPQAQQLLPQPEAGRRTTRRHSKFSRVVVIGLDGMSPRVARRMIKEGKLPVSSDWNKERKITFTVQDPCQLVRKTYGYPMAEDLRYVTKAVVGEENFIDMTHNRSNNYCCGGGGGRGVWNLYAVAGLAVVLAGFTAGATTWSEQRPGRLAQSLAPPPGASGWVLAEGLPDHFGPFACCHTGLCRGNRRDHDIGAIQRGGLKCSQRLFHGIRRMPAQDQQVRPPNVRGGIG